MMTTADYATLPEDRKTKLDVLFDIADARLEEISQNGDQVVSIAIAGAKYTKGNGGFNDGDAVSRNLVATIHDLAGDTRTFHELKAAVKALRAELVGN